jgi:hypothetical protein
MGIYKDLPEDITFFKPREGDNSIVIIPFNNEGAYKVDHYSHFLRGIGGYYQEYICPNLYSGFCPICASISGMNDDDRVKYKAKRRVIYNVISLSESERKIKLWNVPYYFSQKEFEHQGLNINSPTKIYFYFERKEGKWVKYHYETAYTEKGFYVPKDVLSQVINLYDHIHIPEYDEIEQAFNFVYNPTSVTQGEVTQNILNFKMTQFHKPNIKPTECHRKYTRVVDSDE